MEGTNRAQEVMVRGANLVRGWGEVGLRCIVSSSIEKKGFYSNATNERAYPLLVEFLEH